MAQKVSQFPASTNPPNTADLLPIVQGGVTKQTTLGALFTQLLGFLPSGIGGIASDLQGRGRLIIYAWDYMTPAQRTDVTSNTGSIDVAAAVNAALTYAGTFVNPNNAYTDQVKNGATVMLPMGLMLTTSATIVKPAGVSLKGHGKTASIFKSSFNGPIVRNDAGIGYNSFGVVMQDFGIYGDRTKSSQYGLDLLRPLNETAKNIYIQQCGADGFRIRQGGTSLFEEIDSNNNVGAGFFIDGGVNSWSDQTANNLPANNHILFNCHGNANDGPGLKFGNYTNGNKAIGGAYEANYFSSATNVGFNVEFRTNNSYLANSLIDVWVEGGAKGVQAHVYQSSGSISVINRIVRLHHVGTGIAGNVDHCVLNDIGTLIIDSPTGNNASYKTVAGTNAPFRVGKPNAVIYLNDPVGNALGRSSDWVADTSGATTGLLNYLYQRSHGYTRGVGNVFVMDSGSVSALDVMTSGEADAWFRLEPFNRQMFFGDGTSTPDVSFRRVSAGKFSQQNGNNDQSWQSYATNGGYWEWGAASELLTIAAAASTDTSANLLPANGIIEAVTVRVTTVIPTAATFTVGDATIAARFATGVSVAANTTAVGTLHADQTGTSGPRQVSAAKVRITPNVQPAGATGVVRITVFYRSFVPATS